MEYQYASYSDIGCRENNEDSSCVKSLNNSLLCIVADGLGGHANGEIASQLAVEAISSQLENTEFDEDELLSAILKASSAVFEANISGHTTIAVLWIQENRAIAAHVGDSRIYQFRNQEILFQSQDHSEVQMAVLVGELPADAVRHHRDRNKIFRVLGESAPPTIDCTELTTNPGDRFLLCSDGFWEPVTEEDMLSTVETAPDPHDWLASMQQLVISTQDPRQDNHTAVCVFIN